MNKSQLFNEIKILHEDKNLLVINKPSGLMVHGDGRTKEKTLVDWLMEKYSGIELVGEPIKTSLGEVIQKPGIVHRLDRETSGAIIVAKNQESYFFLKKQFQDRTVEKTYHAFVWGKVKNDEETIDRPIGRSGKDFRQWSAMRGARGNLREAVTDYRVISRKNNITFVEVMPRTGRTHQIRVHMKAINHPVVGDTLYAPKQPFALGLQRMALHAYKIKFLNRKAERLEIQADYPPDFANAIREFSKM